MSVMQWRHSAAWTAYLAALTCIYAAALAVPYAFSDTYPTLARALYDGLWGIQNAMLQGGRPLYALVTTLTFPHIHSLAALGWLRLLALLGLACFATAYATALRRHGLPRTVVWALPLLTACLPPFQVYVAWAVCAPYTWAAAFAGLAFLALESKHGALWRLAVSSCALSAAVFLYQPAAMMFWVFAAVAWLSGRRPPPARAIPEALALMGSVLAVDFVLSKTLPSLILGATDHLPRSHVTVNVLAKLAWFWHTPLRQAANLWILVPSTALAVVLLAWTVIGLTLYWRNRGLSLAWRIPLALLLVPLTYLPNLVVAVNEAAYRTAPALTAIVLLYATLALLGRLTIWRPLNLQRVGPILVLTLIGLAAFSAARNVTTEFAVPQHEEWLRVRTALSQPPVTRAARIYFRTASTRDSLAPVVRWDEFGVPSISKPWVPVAMAWLMARWYGVPAQHQISLQMVIAPGRATANLPAGSCIVDLGPVLKGKPVRC